MNVKFKYCKFNCYCWLSSDIAYHISLIFWCQSSLFTINKCEKSQEEKQKNLRWLRNFNMYVCMNSVFHIPCVIAREDANWDLMISSVIPLIQRVGIDASVSTQHQTQGQEQGTAPLKRVFYLLCWLMHSSRARTLGSMTWEVWLWGHHPNSPTSQHFQLPLCALWNIQGQMMHSPFSGIHSFSFSEQSLVLSFGA